MFWQLESIGIEPTEEIGNALVGIGIQEGKVFPAYTKGYTYINHWFKNLQLSIHIKEPHDSQNAEVVGTSMQISGDKSYRLRVIHTLNSLDPDDPLERRILANCADEDKSLFVLDVVNADILPCWKEDTVITLQMIAKAISLHVYADEQAFVDATAVPVQNEYLNDGKETKLTAAVGSFLPMGFMTMHSPSPDEQTYDPNNEDDIFDESRMLITGKILHFITRKFIFDGDEEHAYPMNCAVVETDALGPIDLYGDFHKLPEDEFKLLKQGSIIQASVLLSGDAILNEEKNDLPLSPQNNYALLADVFEYPHRFDRLWGAMAEGCIYRSEGAEAEIQGKDSILTYLHQKEARLQGTEQRYHSHFAVLTEAAGNLPHKIGEHCVVLRKGEEQEYVAIVFLSMDESDRIREIHLSEESGYRFKTVPYDEWAETF